MFIFTHYLFLLKMGLWATGPPGTYKHIKISHIVISGTEGIRANKVAVFATVIV